MNLTLRIPTLRRAVAGLVVLPFFSLAPAAMAQDAAKPAPDTIVFTNGDQLTGKLLRATGGTIVFHSDMAGDLSIPVDKVKELRSSGSFAVLKKDQPVVGTLVRPGAVRIEEGKLTLATGGTTLATLPVGDLGYIIDEQTFRRETNPHPSLWYGWNGSLFRGRHAGPGNADRNHAHGSGQPDSDVSHRALPSAAQPDDGGHKRDLRNITLADHPADDPTHPGCGYQDQHLPRRRRAGRVPFQALLLSR